MRLGGQDKGNQCWIQKQGYVIQEVRRKQSSSRRNFFLNPVCRFVDMQHSFLSGKCIEAWYLTGFPHLARTWNGVKSTPIENYLQNTQNNYVKLWSFLTFTYHIAGVHLISKKEGLEGERIGSWGNAAGIHLLSPLIHPNTPPAPHLCNVLITKESALPASKVFGSLVLMLLPLCSNGLDWPSVSLHEPIQDLWWQQNELPMLQISITTDGQLTTDVLKSAISNAQSLSQSFSLVL